MRYSLTLLFLVISTLFQSCMKPLVSEEHERLIGIPPNSSKVIVDVAMSTDQLFTIISKNFAERGWLLRTSKEALQISCDGRELSGKVFVMPIVHIEKTANGSRAIYRGIYSMNKMKQEHINFFLVPYRDKDKIITWQGWNTSPGKSFEHLVNMARKIPDGKISYAL